MSDAIDTTIDRALAAGACLRAASDERVIAWLEAACAALADPSSPVGREARGAVVDRTGLSAAGAAWALDTTLSELHRPALENGLEAMRRSFGAYRTAPIRAQAIVLAANVFTACLRPIVWSMLARVPAVVKVATLDEGLSDLFRVALTTIDPELAESLAVMWPQGASDALYARLAARVDLVSAHGGDHGIAQMRGATSATTEFLAHGHGLGAIVVLRTALSSHVQSLSEAIARDVAAYDQRGCLSPQLVLVERGGELSPRDLASLLATHGLERLATSMPRGPLPIEIGAQQIQWRGLAASLHELFEGDGYATSFETGVPRPTPGYRNIAVHGFDAPEEITSRFAIYGPHLKVVAIAGDADRIALPSPLAPRVCAPGEMQKPPLLAATDGRAPWEGLHRLR
jgi:hypothetical protein